ncbi:uncharacterized protein KY384_006641 [Bacidia gigantensis]|uniref:uncharacterized protein n=1 Tax=Bacidia gigantensis TaxID=2732470 RepID=UPI001D04EE79|nr:uncharacterized protein KY384_006641 [Bacidia gigantensis]KAG8528952.1 hypothetical protein KY384_006641 [Bacidia gigantensis]
MVWYPLDWCYQMGIHKIHLVTPPSSVPPLEAALSQNPHLTSLPSPKADIVAPAGLTHTTGTAELLRLPEIQSVITKDFVILPCDLVCEVPGESLLESWIVQQGSLFSAPNSAQEESLRSINYRRGDITRKGALGVCFETQGEDRVKGAETDLIITASLPQPAALPPASSLRPHISKLVYATPTDTLRDILQEKGGFPVRSGLIRKHGRVRILTTHRDSHVYFFPHWVLSMITRNEKFDSISEDVVGWWAKGTWQTGLAEKLHMKEALDGQPTSSLGHADQSQISINKLKNLISTHTSTYTSRHYNGKPTFQPPCILSYVHPSGSNQLIRRVDTAALLLSTSIRLAALPPTISPPADASPTRLSHPTKISADSSLIAPRSTIDEKTSLIAPNTSIATHCTIKSSCIGANCLIGVGVRIINSILMDGAQVDDQVSLQGCILGRRCTIGKGSKLEGSEVQEGYRVEEGTVGSKGDKFCAFEGLDGVDDGGNETDLS